MHWFLKFIFGIKFYMFRKVPLSIIRSFSLYTQQWFMPYRLADSLRAVWHKPLLCTQWKTPDDGQKNCPKHVEFHSKNKFEKLVHLVCFSIIIYHDARSPKRQIHPLNTWWKHKTCSTSLSTFLQPLVSSSLLLRAKYIPKHFTVVHLQPVFVPSWDTISTLLQKQWKF